MEEQRFIPIADAFRFIATWKSELDLRRKEIVSRLSNGAIGVVVTIILSAVFASDKISQRSWLVRVALGLCLFLLLGGAANIMIF